MAIPLNNLSMYHKTQEKPSKNARALQTLKDLGYSLTNIRLCFSKLTGISQPAIAEELKISRQNVTLHLGGYRSNRLIQAKIAELYEVPVEEFFHVPQEDHAD